MPQVRITAPGQDGPNPAYAEWRDLPPGQRSSTPQPPHSIAIPIGTMIECTENEAAILVGKKIAERVAPVPPQARKPVE